MRALLFQAVEAVCVIRRLEPPDDNRPQLCDLFFKTTARNENERCETEISFFLFFDFRDFYRYPASIHTFSVAVLIRVYWYVAQKYFHPAYNHGFRKFSGHFCPWHREACHRNKPYPTGFSTISNPPDFSCREMAPRLIAIEKAVSLRYTAGEHNTTQT